MNWSKLAVLVCLFIIVFTTSIFGAYFGYTVEGVPKGIDIEKKVKTGYSIGDLATGQYVKDLVSGGGVKDFGKTEEPGFTDLIGHAAGFFFDMIFFRVDGMPELFSGVFLLMGFVMLYILITMFLPGGGN